MNRYIAARTLWNELTSEPRENDDIANACENIEIQLMIRRSDEITQALADNSDIDNTWIFGITYFGISTYYKVDPDGIITVRMEGNLDNLPLFEQFAVIHEVNLFQEWIPFCIDSLLIHKIGYAELIAYIYMRIPPLSRDTLVQAYGADLMDEFGKVIILGHSIDTYSIPDSTSVIPFRDIGWFHHRFDILELAAIFEITSPNSAKVSVKEILYALSSCLSSNS